MENSQNYESEGYATPQQANSQFTVGSAEDKLKNSRFQVSPAPEPTGLASRSKIIRVDSTPNINNYRSITSLSGSTHLNKSRSTSNLPTAQNVMEIVDGNSEVESNQDPSVSDKFGWIEGVLIRNMLSIWGVMLFLRISWVVALAGIWQALIIIAISTFITLATALSMSAITTNGEIGGGGTYYVMSRILGPEFGGSIGIIFALANAINASLNVVGFSQTLQDVMKAYGGYIIVDGGINDTRIIGTIVIVAVWGLCGLGAKYESKSQILLLLILVVALVNFLVGSIMGPSSSDESSKGFIGYNLELFAENWHSSYVVINNQMQDFFSVFSVYFPACIGILSGANISGNLKKPNSAIPKGTILAIIITSFSYAIVAIICAGTTVRSATGCPNIQVSNETNEGCIEQNATYGSYYDYQMMTLISAYGPLNYAGCFAATMSSALASFVSCPQLLKVIGDDKLYPYWLVGWMTKGYGKSNEPHLAYLFTFIVAIIFILIASLDTVALLISNFFLATFALMNYSTFHVCLVKPIGWRPTFKYYNMWLSLLTAVLCVVAMFLISWPVALATIAIVMAFYLAVLYRKPEVNWGSSGQAQTYSEALTSMQHLVYVEEHVKNYRPQILVLTGPPNHRPALLDFANLICKNKSMLVCGNVIKGNHTLAERSEMQRKAYKYLRFKKIKGFWSQIESPNLQSGVASMLSLAGLGKMKPNILLLGFKNDWRTCDKQVLDQFIATIKTGFDFNVGVAILRLVDGFDYSGILADVEDMVVPKRPNNQMAQSPSTVSRKSMDIPRSPTIMRILSADSNESTVTESNNFVPPTYYAAMSMESTMSVSSAEQPLTPQSTNCNLEFPNFISTEQLASGKRGSKKNSTPLRDIHGNPLPDNITSKIHVFQTKKDNKTIDVWWLHDDGGLTLLLPHIIKTRTDWSSCKLRVFCTAPNREKVVEEHKKMTALLAKLRIEYSNLVVVIDPPNKRPSDFSTNWFNGLMTRDLQGASGQRLSDELKEWHIESNRNLRLRELLHDHSGNSSLIVMTLPITGKEDVCTPLYMAWLEALTANMPPLLLVRGNQTSVLTIES